MDFPLTAEQEAIVTAPADQPLMVLAPPGTGKTHTVIARIVHLIERCELQPYQLAVLCFSRSAVSEIMQRLRVLIKDAKVSDDLRFVSIRTFDSFATQLLLAADPERSLAGTSYDARIKLVVEALTDPESLESWHIEKYKHLIVDEIQDLVGLRAEFVQVMLARISGGFTLLGDPAQAIYGFATQTQGQRVTSQELLQWVKQQAWVNGLLERQLSENYRSTGTPSELARQARNFIQQDENGIQSLAGMNQLIETLQGVGSVLQPGVELKKSSYDSVCILCRTNGEMLQLASMFSSREIGFTMRPRPEDQGLPAWLGRVLSTYSASHITLPEFLARWQNLVTGPNQPEADQAFSWLKRIENTDKPDLNLRTLHLKLYHGARLPDEADAFLQPVVGRISLSTIHAAKGREFEHVVLLKPKVYSEYTENDRSEEARILYVASTRARKALSSLDRTGLPAHIFTVRCNNNRRRWVVALSQYNRFFMEIGLQGDVEPHSSVSKWVQPDATTARMVQDFIWDHVKSGSLLYIHRLNGNRLFYHMRLHSSEGLKDYELAQMSFSFKEDLKIVMNNLSRGKGFRYPGYWSTVRVAAIVTEILPPYPENVHDPFADSGFCLGLRVRGMANISLE